MVLSSKSVNEYAMPVEEALLMRLKKAQKNCGYSRSEFVKPNAQ